MLEQASELLEQFIQIEREKLDGVDMPHMPTLGSAYEEITKQGIDKQFVIPKHLDLQVVSGFISIDGEMISQQIDGMLVHGKGLQYGLTTDYIYPIDQVLCLFEVKKTLNKVACEDAFKHLRKIRKRYTKYFESKFDDPEFEPEISVAQKHFAQLTGKVPPEKYSDIHRLPKSQSILFYTLVQESLAPLSIIHGYGGYKTEKGLRDGFIDIIYEEAEQNTQEEPVEGLGVPSLPSLITTNNFSIVKGNGLPFISATTNHEWVVLMSTRSNAARIMLEVIWSKISIYFNTAMPWGEYYQRENVKTLLLAVPAEVIDRAGWQYFSFEVSERNLKNRETFIKWAPIKVSLEIVDAFNLMLMYGGILEQEAMEYIAKKHDIKVRDLESQFTSTMLFIKDNGWIRPIGKCVKLLTNEDETGYMSSDNEKFDQWCGENEREQSYVVLLFM